MSAAIAKLRRHAGFALLLAALVGAAIWLAPLDGARDIAAWAAERQREIQNALAGALRRLRAGEAGALTGFLGLCFAYGFVHAAGPGHGKLVMGGYALGEAVPRLRLVLLTIAGSLGQAVTAVALVGAGALLLGWGRRQMTDLADTTLQAFSAGAIVLVGLWLLWRGVVRWRASARQEAHGCCGHAHGPDPREVARATGWRSMLAIALAVAIRPCSGAIFVLIITFGMGIALAGIAGAVAMALGTAVLTVAVALGAGSLRGGLAARVQGTGGLRVMAGIEILAGLVVAVVAAQVMLALL